MTVTVKSVAGLDTPTAVILTKSTRDDAIAFYRDYAQESPVTEKCIRDELATPLNDEASANCPSGNVAYFFGNEYQFQGRNARSSVALIIFR